MIGYALWQRRFGGDPSVIGRTISLNAIPYTVTGVLPPDFRGLSGRSAALDSADDDVARAISNQKWNHSYYIVARRKRGIPEEQAR